MAIEPAAEARAPANFLVVGQSHLAAIRAAARTIRAADPSGARTRILRTINPVFGTELVGVREEGADRYAEARFSPLLEEAIAEEIAQFRPLVASVMGGNAHNVLGLIRFERPFDFMASDAPDAPIDPEAELVPEALVRRALSDLLEHDRARLRLLREAAGPFVHLGSPPPVGDDAILAAEADKWFGIAAGGTRMLAPRALRLKIWRLNSRLFRDAIEALGCSFLPVPPETQDSEGFLRTEYAADATHGNEAYGARVIAQLAPLRVAGPVP